MSAGDRARVEMLALKERRGGTPQALLDYVREQSAARTALKRALAAGPLTVPELAAQTGVPARQALWLLTAMRKYGTVVEDSPAGSYVRYALAKRDPRA